MRGVGRALCWLFCPFPLACFDLAWLHCRYVEETRAFIAAHSGHAASSDLEKNKSNTDGRSAMDVDVDVDSVGVVTLPEDKRAAAAARIKRELDVL